MEAKMNNKAWWISETRADVLFSGFRKLLKDSGFEVVKECSHFFFPHGFTALFLLSESHFAIHTFPEEGRTYLELSSCVDAPFRRFLEAFEEEQRRGRL